MNKTFKLFFFVFATSLLCFSCGKKDPRLMGTESGKAQCACYQLEGEEAVNKCLDNLDKKYQEYLNDTAYIEAAEMQMLHCISDGIIDLDKPIKEILDTAKTKQLPDTTETAADDNDTTTKSEK